MTSTKSSNGWIISDGSNSEDESILPSNCASEHVDVKKKKLPLTVFASPSHILEKMEKNFKRKLTDEHQQDICNRSETMHSEKSNSSTNQSINNDSEVKPKCIKADFPTCNPLVVWEKSSPLNYLLNTVSGLPNQFNYYDPSAPICSLHLKDILSIDFGDLIETVQFNYCIDVSWFIEQLPITKRQIPILFVHGDRGADYSNIDKSKFPNIKTCRVDLPPYGTHHTKMMFLKYVTGIRIVIHTSNLVPQDWHQKTQGMWLSPIFKSLKGDVKADKSHFNFQHDLLEYLEHYGKHSELDRWRKLILSHDLSSAKVILIGSVPGRHKGLSLNKWGHNRLRNVLSTYVESSSVAGWPIIGQFSSIGSLGTDKEKWLCSEWLGSFSSSKTQQFGKIVNSFNRVPLKLIFPSVENVRMSLEGYPAGGSIPYGNSVAKKQIWLKDFFHNWKSRHLVRTQASPHIKSYTRISKDCTECAWFLLTSSNLSKAAWGSLEKKGTQLAIRSFELGILFLPQRFYPNKTSFNLNSSPEITPDLVLPFSLPLVPYSPSDEPWVYDIPHKELPDRHGNMWVPDVRSR